MNMETLKMKMTPEQSKTGSIGEVVSGRRGWRAKASRAVRGQRGFTLIELLTVIAIIGVVAGFAFPVMSRVARTQKISHAQGELALIETALENYKAKYGSYPPSCTNVLLNQLYCELSGTTNTGSGTSLVFQTLDGGYSIPANGVLASFGTGGFINCSKGAGEDAVYAKNFLTGLKSTEVAAATNITGALIPYLVTSVGGPDQAYQPTPSLSGNPIRYLYPGTNNPGSYDLWVQLSIGSQFNGGVMTVSNLYLVCNWSSQAQHNNLSVP